MTTKSQLRIDMLAARRAVLPRQRTRAAHAVAGYVAATPWLAPGKRIGLYSSLPGELETGPLLALALERGCEVYLPRIGSWRARRMQFVRFDQRGRIHAYGMHEPAGHDVLGARFLDTIFVPAVALDARGARLGHGAGFYDRALGFRRLRRHWRGPRLVGLAYSFQVVSQIPVAATDIGMDCIVTDRGIDELLAHEDGSGVRGR